MSRFSRAEAEAAGWRIFHEREGYEVAVTDDLTRTVPGSIRAEKYVSLPGQTATLVTEEGETEGLLLERIFAYESHLRGLPQNTPSEFSTDDEPRTFALGEDGGFEVTESIAGSVLVPDPNDPEAEPVRITDAEWTAQNRHDTILRPTADGEELVSFGGAAEDTAAAVEAVDRVRKEAEDLRTSEPHVGPTKQVTTDTAGAVDSPGIGAGGTVVIRADEDSPEEAGARMAQENKDLEDVRVNLASVDHIVNAPEGADLVAGTDAGLATRTDLESEQPGQGMVAGSTPLDSRETPVQPVTAEAVAAGAAAAEEEAKSLRDEHGAASEDADGAPAVQAVEDARSEAVADAPGADEEPTTADEDQENPREQADGAAPAVAASDEAESQSTPSGDGPKATPAAEAFAAENGVDLSQVQGSGKDGKVTKPDVEQHLSSDEG